MVDSAGTARSAAACLLFLLGACGPGQDAAPVDTAAADITRPESSKLLIIGQDLGAIRGYMESNCCPAPDGLTAYVDFYDILKPGDFGGLGIDAAGDDAGFEFDWGAGPVSAWRTATGFGVGPLALGLSITENEHPGKLARLVAGDFDAEIRQLAAFAGMIDGPLYLRIGYEFDGAWNEGYEDAERYIGAYRRIADGLNEAGADNIELVWQASASTVDDLLDGGHEDIRRWYPGDEYVDWLAFSWFMTPEETAQVESSYTPPTPLELADEVIALARETGKPVMIAEAAPQGVDLEEGFLADHHAIWDGPSGKGRVPMTSDEIWEHWYAPLFELMAANGDVIRALAYINADWDSQPMWGPPYKDGFWGDTRLEADEAVAERFAAAIRAWKSSD
jgi:hypothetical protein